MFKTCLAIRPGSIPNRGTPQENDYSVRLELQADYLAGVWASHASKDQGEKPLIVIEPGDVESAIKTANSIGDNKLQQRGGGFVHPEKFTHGTSEQRAGSGSRTALQTGDVSKRRLDYFFEVPSSRDL